MDKRHTHSMEPMSMGAGVPGLFYMQRIFWAFAGTAIAVAALANGINKVLYYQRLRAASHRKSQPAKPSSFFFQSHATLSSVIREVGYYSTPLSVRNVHFYLPSMGPVIMMVGYIVLIVVCSLYGFNTADFLQWENIGYRTGFIAVAQIPLIVLLAGKRNLIGFFTGLGYERLNWLHRWVARSLLFTILIHMGFWMTEWGKYDYIMIKLKTDYLTQIGMAAFAILAWLVLSSVAPIRGLSYEFFVVQHIISYLGFLVAVYFHVPDENRIWVWLPLGFWAFDRVVRAAFLVYNNCSLFHKNNSGILACKATFEPLDGSHTRVTIACPPVAWQAGQHLFLACHALAPLTSHPFTIASLPSDGKIEFIVRAKKGSTKKFFKYAEKAHPTLPATAGKNAGRSVLIDGPYACIRPLRQFDSLLFIAGSTGATFTMPLMRDVVEQWTNPTASCFNLVPAGAVTRDIRFIWVVKHSSAVNWFKSQLQKVARDVENLRNEGHDVTVEISIYVTCDDTITSGKSSFNDDNVNRHSNSNSFASATDEKNTEANILSRTSSITSLPPQNSKCCCTKTISEDGTNETSQTPCYCSHIPTLSKTISTTTSKPSTPPYNLLTGRPNIESLIRKTAEIALGEMAVVVCGPPGLVQGTRNLAIKISDERAVHKGTGAQGIYVHAETFGYA